MSQYISRYQMFFLVINLADYLRQKAQIEQSGKEETGLYGKINESVPSQNYVQLATQIINQELRDGVDVIEKYSTKFYDHFSLPSFGDDDEEVTDHD